jgi:hypothetical protein
MNLLEDASDKSRIAESRSPLNHPRKFSLIVCQARSKSKTIAQKNCEKLLAGSGTKNVQPVRDAKTGRFGFFKKLAHKPLEEVEKEMQNPAK